MARVSVREATFDDLVALIDMGEAMARTSNFRHLRFDGRQFGEFLVSLIVGPQSVVLVSEQDGEVTGAVLGMVTRSMIGPDHMASDLSFFVRPEHRASRAGVALLRRFIKWAVDAGAKRISMGNSAGMDDERYVKLLSRYGFDRAGSLMYMNC